MLFLVLAGPCAWAKGAEVRILAPAPDATLTAKGTNTLYYEAETGSGKGSHVHVYIDGQEIGTLHRLKGDYTLKGLVPGGREICVRIANKAHVPTGVGSCIEVTVEAENLFYAAVQIAHNFGATAVTGGPIMVLAWAQRVEIQHQIARLVLGGWLAQVLSGAAFGALSWHYYGQLPEIHGAALVALVLKLCCAVAGSA